MDGQQFDRVVQALVQSASRRGVLGLLAGAAGLSGREVAAKGSKRGRRQNRVRSAKADKISLCHYDAQTETYRQINVPAGGVQAHLDHGDFVPATEGGCAAGPTCTVGCGLFGECPRDPSKGDCVCAYSTRGAAYCVAITFGTSNCVVPCTSDSECGVGGFCATAACCALSRTDGRAACVPAANICAT
jgi:hypothetical protein